MGKKSCLEMLEFGMAYAKKCAELEEKLEIDLWLGDSELRFDNLSIALDALSDCEDAEEALGYTNESDHTLEELTGNKYLDGVILCEGYVYEALYYFQGYSDTSTFGKEATITMNDKLRKILEKYGFFMDLSRSGTIQLQCHESFEEEMKHNGWNE